jgi:hypothetical protein
MKKLLNTYVGSGNSSAVALIYIAMALTFIFCIVRFGVQGFMN